MMLKKVYIAIDLKSFYASCERLFRPDLRNRPVVVLSNNDGIIIALTQPENAGAVREMLDTLTTADN